MHGVEAMLAAGDAVADAETASRLRGQALRATERVVHGWAQAGTGGCRSTSRAGWEPLPDYNRDRPADPFRPYGVTIGHQFEWARLALHVRSVTPDPPAWLLDDAVALFDAAATRGWAADGSARLPVHARTGTTDRSSVPACTGCCARRSPRRRCWPRSTGEQRYRDDAAVWREHGERLFADPATGSWHHELTPAGEVASGTWAGQPDAYHLVQMLLFDGRPVRGSVAAALRSAGAGGLDQLLAPGAARALQGQHRTDPGGVELQLDQVGLQRRSVSRVSSAPV